MADLLPRRGLRLDLRELAYFSHWLTPPGVPKRFDTRFFVAPAPPGQEAEADLGEAVELMWLTPQAALEPQRGLKLLPVTQRTLHDLHASPAHAPRSNTRGRCAAWRCISRGRRWAATVRASSSRATRPTTRWPASTRMGAATYAASLPRARSRSCHRGCGAWPANVAMHIWWAMRQPEAGLLSMQTQQTDRNGRLCEARPEGRSAT